MSNLEKFNKTIEEFENEVGKLSEVSVAYQKLQTLIEEFKKNSQTFEKIIDIQNNQQQTLSKSLTNLEDLVKQNQIEITSILNEKTDYIRQENKEFYRDLESTIKIKLDENKSQIKQLIESERNQIKEIFEIEFSKNLKKVRQIIESETSTQTLELLKSQKSIKILIWVFGFGILLVFAVLALLKITNII